MFSFLLSRCSEQSAFDWTIATTLDLLTLLWVAVFVAWWVA